MFQLVIETLSKKFYFCMKYRRIKEPKRNNENRMKKLTYLLLAAMVLWRDGS